MYTKKIKRIAFCFCMWRDIVEVDSRKRQIAKQKAKAYQMLYTSTHTQRTKSWNDASKIHWNVYLIVSWKCSPVRWTEKAATLPMLNEQERHKRRANYHCRSVIFDSSFSNEPHRLRFILPHHFSNWTVNASELCLVQVWRKDGKFHSEHALWFYDCNDSLQHFST